MCLPVPYANLHFVSSTDVTVGDAVLSVPFTCDAVSHTDGALRTAPPTHCGGAWIGQTQGAPTIIRVAKVMKSKGRVAGSIVAIMELFKDKM